MQSICLFFDDVSVHFSIIIRSNACLFPFAIHKKKTIISSNLNLLFLKTARIFTYCYLKKSNFAVF